MFGFKRTVLLRDSSGNIYETKERRCGCSLRYCYVYNRTRIGMVILNKGGVTSGESTYIKEWKYKGEW